MSRLCYWNDSEWSSGIRHKSLWWHGRVGHPVWRSYTYHEWFSAFLTCYKFMAARVYNPKKPYRMMLSRFINPMKNRFTSTIHHHPPWLNRLKGNFAGSLRPLISCPGTSVASCDCTSLTCDWADDQLLMVFLFLKVMILLFTHIARKQVKIRIILWIYVYMSDYEFVYIYICLFIYKWICHNVSVFVIIVMLLFFIPQKLFLIYIYNYQRKFGS